ncbi:MAG: tRNA epoxyqueuosine(34) reductase QueG [Gemmatimonadota bacterium]|nr:tRNA epoxyqueuosine(34) reductase QueG [Gemmatimonadota bacterium]
MRERTIRLEEEARTLGFSIVGVTAPDPTGHIPLYREWLRRQRHGEMHYLAREGALVRRADLSTTMDGIRSVVAVAHEYYHRDREEQVGDPSRGIIARYARGADYHRVVKKKLLALLEWLRREVPDVRGRAYVDTGPILERDLASRAGLGWFGRNTMLIHPRRGSYFFLGLLLLDTQLERSAPPVDDHCGTCRACLDACPTGALLGRDANGAPIMDARRCISYLSIELRGPVPAELRPLMGNRIFGCDICQEVCPFNARFATETEEPRYAARGPGQRPFGVEPESPSVGSHPGTDFPELVDLMGMNREDWDAFSRGSAIRRAGYEGFLRSVAVAIGNWLSGRDPVPSAAVEALGLALRHESPLVRGHAAWALGRTAAPASRLALAASLETEEDDFVRGELSAALNGSARAD